MKLRPQEILAASVAAAVLTVAFVFAFNGAAAPSSPSPAGTSATTLLPAASAPAVPAGEEPLPEIAPLPPAPPPEPEPARPAVPATKAPAPAAASVKPPRPAVKAFSCAGQICIDADTGEVLSARNEHVRHPPASVTKLMTIFLVLDAVEAGELRLSSPVVASRRAQDMGGTQVNLAEGETHTVDDLLYALMLQSANDAAVALAEKVSGSVENFVERMNAKARELGMTRTAFSTPHGLPMSKKEKAAGKVPDMTCAADLATLSRALIARHPQVFRYSARTGKVFRADRLGAKPLPMGNHNTLLRTFPGCDGLKTGWTNAGASIVTTASRGNRRVIAVVLGGIVPGAAKGSVDARTSQRERDQRAAELMFDGLRRLDALKYAPTPRTP
ncbi:MAG: D-alanyl-D-alanine carboxypeptidase family protein [Candidatus Spyradosoma sp.]